MSVEGVTVEDEPATLRGLDAFEAGPADFSDYLILEAANRANETDDDVRIKRLHVRSLPRKSLSPCRAG